MFTLTLKVPDEVYARAQAIAQETAQPIERVLEDYLKTLPASVGLSVEVQAELDALPHLSDDALWVIAKSQVSTEVKTRFEHLLGLVERSTEDEEELTDLLERADRLTLRKAEAVLLLKKRGQYPVNSTSPL